MTPLAMHMANELLNLPIAGITLVAATIIVAVALWRTQRLDSRRLTLMGVMGAFVFAGQMINFTLPGMPGTSGHLGGGVLLAILLGPAAGIVTMAAILIVQCLLFQDGGLLALGCNIINMGVVPCLVGWGLYRAILGNAARAKAWRQYLAAWLACIVGVTAGAALVPVQAAAAGVLRIDWTAFLAVMVGVHLIIGCVEGLITFAVVAYLRQTQPQFVGLETAEARQRLAPSVVFASLLVTAALLAGAVSWFASPHADGLEWSYLEHDYGTAQHTVAEPDATIAAVDDFQSRTAPLPDYTRPEDSASDDTATAATEEPAEASAWPAVDGWGSLAGIIGTAVTLLILLGVAKLLRRREPAVA